MLLECCKSDKVMITFEDKIIFIIFENGEPEVYVSSKTKIRDVLRGFGLLD